MHRWNCDQTSEKQSQLWTVSTANLEKSDLNQSLFINTKGGVRLLLPVFHGGSGMKTSGFFICCSKIVYSWWQSAATDGVCEQNTLTRHIFSCLHAYFDSVAHDIGSRCSAHRVIHVSRGCASWFSSTLHFAPSQSLSSSTSSSWSSSSSSMWVGSERSLADKTPLTKLLCGNAKPRR